MNGVNRAFPPGYRNGEKYIIKLWKYIILLRLIFSCFTMKTKKMELITYSDSLLAFRQFPCAKQ